MFWHIIAANRRRTLVLIILMGVLLGLIGFFLGEAIPIWLGGPGPHNPGGDLPFWKIYANGLIGLAIAVLIWVALLLFSLYQSDELILFLSKAHEVNKEMHPQLYNIVEEMKIAASMPAMPRIYIVDDPAPNAFAVGKSPNKSMVCVTAGLLAQCNRDELQGVIAHEIGHIINRDVLYLTVAATMLGSITFISDALQRNLYYVNVGRYRSSRSNNSGMGKEGAIIMVIAFVLIIIGPVLARVLYFSISRRREYLADATSARLTRYPEGLASALEKIMLCPNCLSTAPRATAPFYIVNPYKPSLRGGFFATHPPLPERIKILRGMMHGAALIDYVRSFRSVTNKHSVLIPQNDYNPSEKIALRAPSENVGPLMASSNKSGDIIRAMHGFTFIECTCGMKIKIPPEFKRKTMACPRCGTTHTIKQPDTLATAAILSTASLFAESAPAQNLNAAKDPQQELRIKGKWQTFTCSSCGRNVQISPVFSLPTISCHTCGQKIKLNHS